MCFDLGFSIGGRDVLVASLSSFERVIFEGESVYDAVPAFVVLGSFEVV